MTLTIEPGDAILKMDTRGRVRTPPERREALLAQFDQSGMSGQKFAAWAGIKYPTFANWLQQRGKRAQKIEKEKPVRWLEATMASPTDEKELKGLEGERLIVHGPGSVRMEIGNASQAKLAVQILRGLGAETAC